MKYPSILVNDTVRIARARIIARVDHDSSDRLEDLTADLTDAVRWWGEGPELDVDPLSEARHKIEVLARDDMSRSLRDSVEGEAACHLYQALEQLNVETPALDEPGFWAYISLVHAWNFIVWREPNAFTARRRLDGAVDTGEKFKTYIDGRKTTECVPARMYLRIRCLGGLEHASLASSVREGTDFWRSHILRIKAGEHPSFVRAIVRRQADDRTRLNTTELRGFAKDLTRTLTNLVPPLLSDEEADDLVHELWNRYLDKAPSTGIVSSSAATRGNDRSP